MIRRPWLVRCGDPPAYVRAHYRGYENERRYQVERQPVTFSLTYADARRAGSSRPLDGHRLQRRRDGGHSSRGMAWLELRLCARVAACSCSFFGRHRPASCDWEDLLLNALADGVERRRYEPSAADHGVGQRSDLLAAASVGFRPDLCSGSCLCCRLAMAGPIAVASEAAVTITLPAPYVRAILKLCEHGRVSGAAPYR